MKKDNDAFTPADGTNLKKLVIRGGTYYTTYTRKFENRKSWQKPDEKAVLSFIPGTIRQISVKEGDWVKTGDKLMVLEAMKMMNTIYSPAEGKILTVAVKEGDRIPKGALMVRFA
jgi:biotin carboxyl carrier protein